MPELELIKLPQMPEGFDVEGTREWLVGAIARAFEVNLVPLSEMPVVPCRICVVADATGADDLCDTCRSAVIASRVSDDVHDQASLIAGFYEEGPMRDEMYSKMSRSLSENRAQVALCTPSRDCNYTGSWRVKEG